MKINVGDFSDESGVRDLQDVTQSPSKRLWKLAPMLKEQVTHNFDYSNSAVSVN